MNDFGQCPTCEITIEGRFCRTCGTILIPLPPNPLCKCGKEISKNDRYCRWCGRKVSLEGEADVSDVTQEKMSSL